MSKEHKQEYYRFTTYDLYVIKYPSKSDIFLSDNWQLRINRNLPYIQIERQNKALSFHYDEIDTLIDLLHQAKIKYEYNRTSITRD